MPVTTSPPLRRITATVVMLSGVAQVAMLWSLELGAEVLLTALCGGGYLLLGLGLFGVSRFTLALAAVACGLRVGTGFNALPMPDWEQLRSLADLLIAVSSAWLFWRARHAPTH
jgi:hypothetical protein